LIGNLNVEGAAEAVQLRDEYLTYVFLDNPVNKRARLKELSRLSAFDERSGTFGLESAIAVNLKDLAIEALIRKSILAAEELKPELGWNTRTSRSGEINLNQLSTA
jgi:hypothetical protein